MEFLSKIFKSTFVKPRYDTESFLSVKHSVKIDFRTNTRPVSYFFLELNSVRLNMSF